MTMDYKKMITELIGQINEEKILRRIYLIIVVIFQGQL